MRDPVTHAKALWIPLLVATLPMVRAAAQEAPPNPEEEVQVTAASPEEVSRMLAAHATALRDKVRSLLEQELTQGAGTVDRKQLDDLIDGFVRIVPPWKPPRTRELITLRPGGRGGGSSVKPGNLVFDFRNWSSSSRAVP